MKKSQELYKKLDGLKNEIKDLQNAGKVNEAHAKLGEIENLKKEIEVQVAMEDDDMTNFRGKDPIVDNNTDKIVAFNKAVLGKPLTGVENALVISSGEDGGYLVPIEQRNQIEELKRELIPLKDYCNVIPVGSASGTMPLEVDANDELTNFEEVTDMNPSDIKFGQVKWTLGDYGDIVPVSNSLLQDEKANLTNFVGRRFAKKAVRTENKKILELIASSTKVPGTSHDDIRKTLNTKLDPAIAANAIVITNQDGFDYLDGLVDSNGRPLLTESLSSPNTKLYKGKPIVVLSNQHLKTTASKLPFYVGDLAAAVSFFDRGAYEMAVSKEAGFTKNATFMRVIERFDVKSVDTDAMKYVELTIAQA